MIIFQPRVCNTKQHLHRGVYFHGELEKICGYDLVYTTKEEQEQLPVGKTTCCVQVGVSSYECYCYVWFCHHNAIHGLIVLKNNVEDNDYAQQKMKDKVISL